MHKYTPWNSFDVWFHHRVCVYIYIYIYIYLNLEDLLVGSYLYCTWAMLVANH